MTQAAPGLGDHAAAGFLEDLVDAGVMECCFPEHMAERDLLLLDDLGPHVAACDPDTSASPRHEFIAQLCRTLNEPSAEIRRRLLRISADSPDFLAAIRDESK